MKGGSPSGLQPRFRAARRLKADGRPDGLPHTAGRSRAGSSIEVMFPRVREVLYGRNYWLELSFTDGTKKQLDFRQMIVGRGGVFEPLEDIELFKQVKVDSDAGTIVWPNGVDFCPDVLYSLATGKPIPVLEPA